ncbi:MAG: Gfo/Idh/MocA family oxidoreductase [Anaerolineae bacterium]|nr:Gfo/Idh/MocA family oxidoreductase [Anaerolineae bacterium]NUQ06860.1 Gfo/Idh/MocA family oxidoreductase [Anaerolineae bacterium]
MGGFWFNTIESTPGAEIVACVDTNPEALERVVQSGRMRTDQCFTSFEVAARSVQADAVLIATPPDMHESVCIAAVEAGLHVLCEKPQAESIVAARRMVAAADAANRVLMVAQNRRHNPFIHTLARLVREGRQGRPGQTTVTFRQIFTRDSFRDMMAHPLLIDMANHHFDAIRAVLGKEPEGVMGTDWNPSWSRFQGAASAVIVFDYADGSRVVYEGTWHAIDVDLTSNGCDWRIECENGLYACKNEIVYEGRRGDSASGSLGSVLEPVPMVEMERQGHAYLLDEFISAVRSGHIPQTTGEDNLNTLGMVLSAVEAVETGRRVRLVGVT